MGERDILYRLVQRMLFKYKMKLSPIFSVKSEMQMMNYIKWTVDKNRNQNQWIKMDQLKKKKTYAK